MNSNPEMKGWKSYVLWEGLPFLICFLLFGTISVLNWQHEFKLIQPMRGSSWVEIHLGEVLLLIALGQCAFAACILYIVRRTAPKSGGHGYQSLSLVLVGIFLILPATFIVILGPAAITMKQQMEQVEN